MICPMCKKNEVTMCEAGKEMCDKCFILSHLDNSAMINAIKCKIPEITSNDLSADEIVKIIGGISKRKASEIMDILYLQGINKL